MTSVRWFRRDRRLADNPALLSAVAGAAADPAVDGHVVPLFVLDPALWRPAGPTRRAHLAASLADLGARVGGLQLRRGDPVQEVVAVARAAHATTVHIAEDFGPRGRQRDLEVQAALACHGIELVRTGSPYAVPPGRVLTKTRSHYRVFTPYSRAWQEHGWPAPPMPPHAVRWVRPLESHHLDDVPLPEDLSLPAAGEPAARRRWQDFLARRLDDYATTREPGSRFRAWCDGHTGYPIVDAGMRQLRSEGWMHNRIRMIAASFLVKDLHIEWRHGARHFMRWLVDADLASNQHGWQWTAGSGTDAAPHFRIFNPTLQGRRFDPHGDFVRRYVPELRNVDAKFIHEPWTLVGGPPCGYPLPIVDHGHERREYLRRFEILLNDTVAEGQDLSPNCRGSVTG